MDKAYKTEIRRVFVVGGLPAGVDRNSGHLQILDSYLPGDRLRLRTLRYPATRQKSFLLQQRQPVGEDLGMLKIAEIVLDKAEAATFEQRGLSEIRKNRYLLRHGPDTIDVDVYLGPLRGLVTATARFEDSTAAEEFVMQLAGREVTREPIFWDSELALLEFSELKLKLVNG